MAVGPPAAAAPAARMAAQREAAEPEEVLQAKEAVAMAHEMRHL